MAYDPEALLIGAWVPELLRLPIHLRHAPFEEFSSKAAQALGSDAHEGLSQDKVQSLLLAVRRTYPIPMLDPSLHMGSTSDKSGKQIHKKERKAHS